MARKKKSPSASERTRGVASLEEAQAWISARGIEDIECIVPDQAGVARGKMMPVEKFIAGPTMAMPVSIFTQTIAGDWPHDDETFQNDSADQDIHLEPDFSTLSVVPWESDPTAQVIHDAYHADGRPVEIAPRQVLRRVIELYRNRGWMPVVAPEIEFYLVKPNKDPDYPLEPPTGRSGRPESARQSYSIAAVNEFDELFDDIYDFSEQQELEIDTLIHEEGAAQMEINLRHGDPLVLADQVFQFKRTIREAALRHDMYATFMAKPMSREPGSAMHIHQSVTDMKTGNNIFSDEAGDPTPEFFAFIGGSQKYLPAVTCIMAPYVNSYRRLVRYGSAPVNTMWGYDNRTVGLRVPYSPPAGAAHREPHPLLRRQSVSRHRRLARLRLSRHDRGADGLRAGRRLGACRKRSRCRAACSRRWRCSRSARSWPRSSASASSPPTAPSSRPSSRPSCR